MLSERGGSARAEVDGAKVDGAETWQDHVKHSRCHIEYIIVCVCMGVCVCIVFCCMCICVCVRALTQDTRQCSVS